MALFTYFDCESDAGAAQKATCLSVAAVTVDENFKIVDQWKINSRFRKSRAFEVDAMLAHNIPVEVIENEKLSNSELVDEWEKKFKDLRPFCLLLVIFHVLQCGCQLIFELQNSQLEMFVCFLDFCIIQIPFCLLLEIFHVL